jgi:hypothetical protein
MLSTSKCSKLSRIRMRTSLYSVEHRRLKTLNFGKNTARVEAKKMSHGPIILSSLKFLQLLAISSRKYGGFSILGIVRDSSSFQERIALHIPVLLILFQAGRTRRLSRGHLQQSGEISYLGNSHCTIHFETVLISKECRMLFSKIKI